MLYSSCQRRHVEWRIWIKILLVSSFKNYVRYKTVLGTRYVTVCKLPHDFPYLHSVNFCSDTRYYDFMFRVRELNILFHPLVSIKSRDRYIKVLTTTLHLKHQIYIFESRPIRLELKFNLTIASPYRLFQSNDTVHSRDVDHNYMIVCHLFNNGLSTE
jgi:hypothetical protein